MLHLLVTTDGSHTIRDDSLNETFHSIHGAIQESEHVYIKHGLHLFKDKSGQGPIKILEVGFGTGLNALLTGLDKITDSIPIIYDAIESSPLPKTIVNQLNYPDLIGTEEARDLWEGLHRIPWDQPNALNPKFSLHKIHREIQSCLLSKGRYDLVYFDAFAPNKQPDIWTMEVLSHVIGAINSGGILVTYCASGQFKRNLISLGMEIESLEGPAGKKEVVRATKQRQDI